MVRHYYRNFKFLRQRCIEEKVTVYTHCVCAHPANLRFWLARV